MSGYDRGVAGFYLFFARKYSLWFCEHAGLWLKLGHLGRCKTWIRIKSPNNPQLLSSITCWGRKRAEKFQQLFLVQDKFSLNLDFGVLGPPACLIEAFLELELRLSSCSDHKERGSQRHGEGCEDYRWRGVSARIKIGLDRIPSWRE